MRVCHADNDIRNQQDFVKGRVDRQRAEITRPEPQDVFVGGETLTLDDGLTPLQGDNYAELAVD